MHVTHTAEVRRCRCSTWRSGGCGPRRRDPRQKQPRTDGAAPAVGELRRQCRQEYDQLRDGVLKVCIEAEWVRQEAEAQGVERSEAEVRRFFEDQKERASSSEKG